MSYLDAAKQIFEWLSQFQVKEKTILFKKSDNKFLEFDFVHPVKGRINCRISQPEGKYFQHEGIGFVIRENKRDGGVLDVYDFGGIFDPIDNQVVGTHYATTHFAWLGALIYQGDQDKKIFELVRMAIQFHLRTSQEEYVFDDWNYHWDFQNLAFIDTYNLLKDDLDEQEKRRWLVGLKNWRQNSRNPLTNWVAMRVYANMERFQLFHRISDLFKVFVGLFRINRAYHKNGCFDDELNLSRPIQYHVYTLALLHKILINRSSKKLEKQFLNGVKYFISFIDPDGCFNYTGRGQEQIFGYATAIYALEAAAQLDIMNAGRYKFFAKKIWSYLSEYKKNNHFPLVLNLRDDKEKFGWYDYHHLTVYNAFLGVWLASAAELFNAIGRDVIPLPGNFKKLLYEEETGDYFFRNDTYFFQLSDGLPEYLSEAAITPNHIWFKSIGWVFSCPGGPSRQLFGKRNISENIEKNLIAPIFTINNEIIITAFNKSKVFINNSQTLNAQWKFDFCNFERVVHFNEDLIEFNDVYNFVRDQDVDEWRYFNFPVVVDKFEICLEKDSFLLNHKGESVRIKIAETNIGPAAFELLEEIKTAKGLAKIVALRRSNTEIKSGERFFIKYVIEMPKK